MPQEEIRKKYRILREERRKGGIITIIVDKEMDSRFNPGQTMNENVPTNENPQIAPGASEALMRPATDTAVYIGGSTVKMVNIGSGTKTTHIEGNTIELANITVVHHHYGGANESEGSFGSPCSAHNPSAVSSKTKKLSEGDETKVGREVYIYQHCRLRNGYDVFKGKQKLLHGKVSIDLAVKIFHIVEGDEDLFKGYIREVKQMIQFSHSNIVRFIHCDQVCDNKLGAFYIAMELCHEMTLADVNAAFLRRDQKQNLFLQICAGVEYLHKNKIAHMDLKPSNILFSRDGEKAVVSDFGLSKCVDIKKVKGGKTYINKSSSKFGGTLGWISAEMIQPNTRKAMNGQQDNLPDYFKTDIFSLGLVGHNVFYGLHPFRSLNYPDRPSYWEVNINERRPPVIGSWEFESAEPDVTDLFEKMLNHDPKLRPNIVEVMQHWMFWSPTKKLNFFTDMYNHYFDNGMFRRRVKENGTEEQKLAYGELPDTSDTNTSAFDLCSSRNQVSPESDRIPTTQFNDTSAKQAEGGGPSGKEKILMRMREAMEHRWMDKIETTSGYRKSDNKVFKNSLVGLVRFIRNNIARTVSESEDRKYATVQCWISLFPKLWPYILEILEPAFTKEDEKEYKCINTHTGDNGVKSLLGI